MAAPAQKSTRLCLPLVRLRHCWTSWHLHTLTVRFLPWRTRQYSFSVKSLLFGVT